MRSCNVMTEPTRITPNGRIGCCSSLPAPVFELPVGIKTIRGGDEESQRESDWVSEWESDWESGGEKELTIVRQMIEDGSLEPQLKRLRPRNTIKQKNEDDDSEHRIKRLKSSDPIVVNQRNEDDDAEPKLMRLKSMFALTGDDGEFDDEDDDDEEDMEDSDDTNLEVEGACHYCKCSKFKRKVQCSRCPIRFCGLCLQSRNGEQLQIETQEGVKWVCPKCRGGCGPGCNNCCTCVPCRRSQGLPPARQLYVWIARHAGFDNVHDYLIHRQTRESPEMITKRKEGRGWTKAGGIKGSWSTGITTGKPKTGQIWTPPYCATNWIDQQTGLLFTILKDGGDIVKSTSSSMKQRDGVRGGASKLSRDIKNPANKLEAWKLTNEQYKKALNQKQELLDPVLNQVLGMEAKKPTRSRLSLDQILNRLLYPEDQAGSCRSGALFGNVQQITRNRKHRKLGRILEPSMFRKRNSKHDKARKINKVTPGYPEDQAGQCISGAPFGNVQDAGHPTTPAALGEEETRMKKREHERNRKRAYRAKLRLQDEREEGSHTTVKKGKLQLGIPSELNLEPSMFRKRNSKHDKATKINKVTPVYPEDQAGLCISGTLFGNVQDAGHSTTPAALDDEEKLRNKRLYERNRKRAYRAKLRLQDEREGGRASCAVETSDAEHANADNSEEAGNCANTIVNVGNSDACPSYATMPPDWHHPYLGVKCYYEKYKEINGVDPSDDDIAAWIRNGRPPLT